MKLALGVSREGCDPQQIVGWRKDCGGLGSSCQVGQLKSVYGDFPGGTVVEDLPAGAGDTGSSPGPGRSHMPRGRLDPCATTTEPAL